MSTFLREDGPNLPGGLCDSSVSLPTARTPANAQRTATVVLGPPPGRWSKAIVFAWGVEIIAVAMGLILAVFAGIEGSDEGPLAIAIACLPFVALSVIELTKIPLVGLAFQVRSRIWRILAITALLFVTGATFENFVFGFERGFNERLRAVETADQAVRSQRYELQLAANQLPQLQARQRDIEAQLGNLDKSMTATRDQAQADITNVHANDSSGELRAERVPLQTELNQIEQRRATESNAELARCRASQTTCFLAGINSKWNRQRDQVTKRLAQIDDQQHAEHAKATNDMAQARAKRDADLDNMIKQRESLLHQVDDIGVSLTTAQAQALHGGVAVAAAERTRDSLIERSQLHRLSDVLFGDHERASLELTKKYFVVSLAAIVAVIGSVIAAMHYAAQVTTTQPRRYPLINAIRGYLARRRARLPVIREIREAARQRNRMVRTIRSYYVAKRAKLIREVQIIKEVPVDRLKVVFLPHDMTEEEVAQVRAEAMKASRPTAFVPATAAANESAA